MRENICEQIDFILQGGLWDIITEEIAKLTSSALIVKIENDDIIVLQAVNARVDRLIFKGMGSELLSYSPDVPYVQKLYFDSFLIPVMPQLGQWTNVIRFHCKEWDIYVLIMETPSQNLLDALSPYLKVISHWISLKNSSLLEERLSTLSYMILTTKNTLASAFEPMSIEYYAGFLRDVFKESLFPQKIAIYIDDGFSTRLLKGDDLGAPNRSDLFVSMESFPTPIVYKAGEAEKIGLNPQLIKGASVVVLPITYKVTNGHNDNLFCIGVWEKPNAQEVLNFMELLGNIASKALEIRHLNVAVEENTKQLDSSAYTVAAFYNVLQELTSYNDRLELLSFLSGFFSEFSQAERVKLVVYDIRERKYFLVGESICGITAQCFDPLTEPMERIQGSGEAELNESGLELLGFKFKDMPKCEVYPLWVEKKLEGFVALHNIKCDAEISDYPIVFRTFCQIVARELYYKFTK